MRSASSPPASDSRRLPLSRRAIALLLALIAHILVVLVLLWLTPAAPPAPPPKPPPAVFSMYPDKKVSPAPSKEVAKVKKTGGGAAIKTPTPTTKPVATRVTPPTPPMGMLIVGKDVFAAGDIAKIPSHSGDQVASGTGAGQGDDSGDDEAVGTGPGGEKLYAAEWYRRPRDAELDFYMPKERPPGSWAVVACRTIAAWHVDQCRELGESPRGSGLARGVRQAAWQFLVRPPRVGGKPLVGAWVSIRIDFTNERGR